jgi:hypothetical protein
MTPLCVSRARNFRRILPRSRPVKVPIAGKPQMWMLFRANRQDWEQ